MDKSFFTMIFFLVSSFLCCNNDLFLDSEIYSKVSENLCNINEYGIRVEYVTSNSMLDELKMYEPYLDYSNINLKENNTSLNIEWMHNNLFIIEEEENTRVQIDLVSEDYIDIKKLKIKFESINNKDRDDINYYTYIKGNIFKNNIDIIENDIVNLFNGEKIDTIQKMSLKGGTTGIINLENGYQFNYSIMTYDEDRILILGTPIIFTTY